METPIVLEPAGAAAPGLAAVVVVVDELEELELSEFFVQPPRTSAKAHARTRGFFIPTNRMREAAHEPLRARAERDFARYLRGVLICPAAPPAGGLVAQALAAHVFHSCRGFVENS